MLLVALFVELEKALLWADGESHVDESEASKEATGRMVEGILLRPDEFLVGVELGFTGLLAAKGGFFSGVSWLEAWFEPPDPLWLFLRPVELESFGTDD